MSALSMPRVAQWLMIALAFTIPQQVAVNNLVLAVLVLLALPSYGRALPALISSNAVARAALTMFGLLCLGALWGDAPFSKALGILAKYIDLALIPVFMLLLRDKRTRHHCLQAFFIIMGITWVLSWAIGLQILPISHWVRVLVGPSAQIANPSIFHSYITQGLMTSYACFLLLLLTRQVDSIGRRWVVYLLAAQAAAIILFMFDGRTGYLVLFTLLVWLGWVGLRQTICNRGWGLSGRIAAIFVTLLLPLVLITVTYQTVPRIHDRIARALTEVYEWHPGQVNTENSMGTRMSLYSNSMQLIASKPILGYGTGGLPQAYAQLPSVDPSHSVDNPHNEYLMQAIQLGVLGPVMLIYLFVTLWRCAARLPFFERDAARGLVLAYSLTSLFNSMLLDHTEGLFFAFFTAWLFANLDETAGSEQGQA